MSKQQAVAYHNEAVKILNSDRQLAYKFFVSAVEADPTLSQAWFAIGNIDADLSLRHGAVACFRRAVEDTKDNVQMWTNLSHILYHIGEYDESKAAALKAIELDPKTANAWMNLSLVTSIEGKVDESLAHALKSYELDKSPTTEMTVAFAYLHARILDKGLKHFEAKLPYKLPQYLSFPWPRWRGEDISGKILFVISDQGLGDTLCFMRFIPQVAKRCERVIMHLQGEIIRTATLMLMDVPNVEISPLNIPLPICDTWVAITSLPVALELTSDEIEYAPQLLVPAEKPDDESPVWKQKERKLHIAISWAGSTGNDINRHRSIPVENFLALSRVPGIQLYSMQVGEKANDVHMTGGAAVIKDLSPWIRDVYDSIGILQHIDLVISIESFLPHLASALGMEVWIPYSRDGKDWRVGQKGQRIVWHHNVRLFHQDETLSWGPTFNEICAALNQRLGSS